MLSSLPRKATVSEVEEAFDLFQKSSQQMFGTNVDPADFKKSLKILEGNFIRIQRDDEQGHQYVEYQSPSVSDFVTSYMSRNPKYIECLVGAMAFFGQVVRLMRYADKEVDNNGFGGVLAAHKKDVIHHLVSTLQRPDHEQLEMSLWAISRRGVGGAEVELEHRVAFTIELMCQLDYKEGSILQSLLASAADGLDPKKTRWDGLEQLFTAFWKFDHKLFSDEIVTVFKRFLIENSHSIGDWKIVAKLSQKYYTLFTPDESEEISETFECEVDSEVDAYLYDCQFVASDLEDYVSDLKTTASEFGVRVDDYVQKLEERIEELEEAEKKKPPKPVDVQPELSKPEGDASADKEIDALFERLSNITEDAP